MATTLTAERVGEIYKSSIVIDGSIAPKMDSAQVQRMQAAGVTTVNWTVCSPHSDLSAALIEIAEGLEIIDQFSDDLLLVRTAEDIEVAKSQGKVGIIFGPQNARPATADLHHLRVLHEMGIRILQLTYNERNLYGDGVAEPANAGLSVLGRRAIEEMNRLGMVIDVSHCGDRVTTETIEMSEQPVLISHANARAVHPSPRNKTDDHLRLLAANGGVIGLSLWSPMLAYDHWPNLDDFVRQVAHVIEVVGVEHVGIGTDHNESASEVEWTANSSKGQGRYQSVTGQMGDWYVYATRCADGGSSILDLPAVAEAISTLGLSEEELSAILGGNMMRLFRTVWGS